jgi:hypothetical protein
MYEAVPSVVPTTVNVLVDVGQSVGQGRAEIGGVGGRQRSPTQGLGEAHAVDVLHDQVRHVARDARIEQPDESGVLEATQGSGLLGQPRGVLAVGGPHDLHGHDVTALLVGRAKDVGHASAADEVAESVPTVEQVAGGTHRWSARSNVARPPRSGPTSASG